jgi:hypothetical protein
VISNAVVLGLLATALQYPLTTATAAAPTGQIGANRVPPIVSPPTRPVAPPPPPVTLPTPSNPPAAPPAAARDLAPPAPPAATTGSGQLSSGATISPGAVPTPVASPAPASGATPTVVTNPAVAGTSPPPPPTTGGSSPPPSPTAAGATVAAGPEIVAKRTATSSTFATSTPGQLQLVTYAGPVHYQDASGSWQDINTSLVAGPPGRWHTEANSVTVSVATDSQDPNLVSVSQQDASISLSLVGAQPGRGVVTTAPLPRPANVVVTPTANTIVHAGILPGVTQTFSSVTNGLKDSLALSSPAAGNVFTYRLSLRGLTASIEPASGDVIYRDASGRLRARTPRGFMTDSNVNPHTGHGVQSDGVSYQLVSQAGATLLVMSVDRAWLADPARVFPVNVDPAIAFTSTDFQDDTYVESGHTYDQSGSYELQVGTYNGGANVDQSFMNFNVSQLYGAHIVSADFSLFNNTSWSCSPRGLGVYRVTQGWDGHTMTAVGGIDR